MPVEYAVSCVLKENLVHVFRFACKPGGSTVSSLLVAVDDGVLVDSMECDHRDDNGKHFGLFPATVSPNERYFADQLARCRAMIRIAELRLSNPSDADAFRFRVDQARASMRKATPVFDNRALAAALPILLCRGLVVRCGASYCETASRHVLDCFLLDRPLEGSFSFVRHPQSSINRQIWEVGRNGTAESNPHEASPAQSVRSPTPLETEREDSVISVHLRHLGASAAPRTGANVLRESPLARGVAPLSNASLTMEPPQSHEGWAALL